MADWSVDQLAWTVGDCSGDECGVILWNNSSTGATFYVYKFIVNNTNSGEIIAFYVQETIGTFYNNAYPVLSNGATPPGQVYSFHNHFIAEQTLVPFDQVWVSESIINFDADFPMMAIAPNSGACFTNQGAGAGHTVTWWYVWK